jgi:Na+-translocating ferredoxin:NAD+ oxidoreductase RnfG subunit
MIFIVAANSKDVKIVDFKNECKKISEDIQIYNFKKIKFGHFIKDEKEFFVFLTSDFSKVKGYQGITEIIFSVDRDLIIHSVNMVRSEETPDYINFMQAFGFFSGFSGKTLVLKENNLSVEVDVISGATSTSKAVKEDIKNSLIEAKKIIESSEFDNKTNKLKFNKN